MIGMAPRAPTAVLLLVMALFSAGCSEHKTSGPVVVANGEELHGTWEEEGQIAAFKGVPFAAPPVGELRWRAPLPHAPRQGPRAVTEFAPACMQGPHITNWYASVAKDFGHGPDAVGKRNRSA